MNYLTESTFRLLVALLVMSPVMSVDATAAWPWTKYEGTSRIDPIGPVGNRLPDSYRRQYNRPTYLGGKIAAKIAPSSQEAMAFRRSDSLGLYDHTGIKGWFNGKNCPPQRVEQHYFYPKPWEVLAVGPRSEMKLDDGPELVRDESMRELLQEDPTASMDLGDGPEMLELPAPKQDSLELP